MNLEIWRQEFAFIIFLKKIIKHPHLGNANGISQMRGDNFKLIT